MISPSVTSTSPTMWICSPATLGATAVRPLSVLATVPGHTSVASGYKTVASMTKAPNLAAADGCIGSGFGQEHHTATFCPSHSPPRRFAT